MIWIAIVGSAVATDAKAFRLQLFAFGNSVDVSKVALQEIAAALTERLASDR